MPTGSGSVKSHTAKTLASGLLPLVRRSLRGCWTEPFPASEALQGFGVVCKRILCFQQFLFYLIRNLPEFAVPSELDDRQARRFTAGSLQERTRASWDRRGQPGPSGVDLKRGESAPVRS